MKEIIKKSKVEILLILVLIVVLSNAIILKNFGNLDEIWNYNLSKNIAEGKIPYKDFNIVQLPGFFMITSVFLRLCNELIVTRILGVLLSTGIMVLVYKILKDLKINKYVSAIVVGIITYMFYKYFCLDYNFFNLLIILSLMHLENKNFDKHDVKTNLTIGILAGCSFLVKQTTGGFVIIASILLKLLQINKKSIKQIFKEIFIRCIGIIVPILLFAIYLSLTNSWKDFIDYAILGIATFNNKVSYLNLMKSKELYIRMLSIIVPAYFVGLAIWSAVKRDKTLIFLLYGVASFIVVYPISDNIHFLIGALPGIVGIIYFVYRGLFSLLKKYKKCAMFFKYMAKSLFWTISILLIIAYGIKLFNGIKHIKNYNELAHFKYIPIDEGLKNRIKNVDKYILKSDKTVYVLDATAAIYMIPLDRYNKDYDMFLKGNIGGEGEKGQIEKLKNMQDVYLLVMHDPRNRNWQTPTEVIKYVEENWKKVNSVELFDVYAK